MSFVSFTVAGIQAFAGNPDHALRALAHCANSTFFVTGVALGLFCEPLGGVIGAAVVSYMGLSAQSRIAQYIDDSRVRDEIEVAAFKFFFVKFLTRPVLEQNTDYLMTWLLTTLKPMLESVFPKIADMLPTGATAVSKHGVYNLLEKAIDKAAQGVSFQDDERLYTHSLLPSAYHIKNALSNGALDLVAGLPQPGVDILHWGYHKGPNQIWTFQPGASGYLIKNGSGGTYMSFASAAVATNGTPVTGNPLRAVWKVECDGDHYK